MFFVMFPQKKTSLLLLLNICFWFNDTDIEIDSEFHSQFSSLSEKKRTKNNFP